MARKQIQCIFGKYLDGTFDLRITEHSDPCDGTGAFIYHKDEKLIESLAILESWEIGQILGGN